jgi:hypothetical protein
LVRDGIRRWIRSPRDVVRLANAVKFSWPAVESEIDPQDLVAMEGLRLFDASASRGSVITGIFSSPKAGSCLSTTRKSRPLRMA